MASRALLRNIEQPTKLYSFKGYVKKQPGRFYAVDTETGDETIEQCNEFEPIDGHGHMAAWPNGALLRRAQWGAPVEAQEELGPWRLAAGVKLSDDDAHYLVELLDEMALHDGRRSKAVDLLRRLKAAVEP